MSHSRPRRSPTLSRIPPFFLCLFLVLTASAAGAIEVVKSEPAEGSTLERPVRSVRIFFDEPPDVAQSELALQGPESAALEIVGLHSMGADDLMATVTGRMPNGEYTLKWKTAGADGAVKEGEIRFTLRRGSSP